MIDNAHSQKVFCVGFQKTGTTSLGEALNILGYKVQGYYPFRTLAQEKDLTLESVWSRAVDLLDRYDAFKDTPWPIFYDRINLMFPDAKFIHVKRDPEKWIRSAVEDFGDHPNEIHRLIYGSSFPVGNERNWVDRYNKHNKDVEEYFAGNADRFISLDMNKGDCNWNLVCNFLGKPVPDALWPHSNSKNIKRLNMIRWKFGQKLQRAFGVDKK